MASNRVTIKDHTGPLLASIQRATARALNRAIVTTRVDVIKKLQLATGVKQAVIRERLTIERASPQQLEAAVVVSHRPIPLIEFGARQTAAGVTTARGQFRRGAFLATMRSGHRGVFKRRSVTRSRRGLPRGSPELPIREQTGPPLPAVAARAQILQSAQAVGQAAFSARLPAEIKHELGGA